MLRGMAGMTLLVALSLLRAAAQQTAPGSNRLVSGKLIYVAPMPGNLDRWIMDDLRIWGKYRATTNPEGVDVVIDAIVPERSPGIVVRGGIPQPRPRAKKPTLPEK